MKLKPFTIIFLTILLSLNISAFAQRGAGNNSSSTQNINITDVSMIPANSYNSCQEAYEAQREQLQRDLANRAIGTGIAYYTGGSCTGSSANNATNGTFYFRGPNGNWTGDEVQEFLDLEECINAMLNEPTCDGGTIIWGKGSDGTITNDSSAMYKIWTPGDDDNRGRTYNFNGQGKIKLEWNTGTNDIEWGMINVAYKKTYNAGLPTSWPNDTVIFSNITIDGCAAWSGNNDIIMNRGKTPVITHTWPLLWVNNHKAVIIINNGTFFQNSCGKKVSNNDFDSALKAGAFILRKGKCFMYGGAFMDNDVRNTGGYINSTASGGALFVKDGDTFGGVTYPTAEFYMYGGSFIGNSSNATKDNYGGGAMYIAGKAKLMGGMIGGDILGEGNQYIRRGNLANQGGGLVVVKGADVEIGGSITISRNGTYNNANASGGGVYICGNSAENHTLFNVNGGEISHNTSANKGGGLYLDKHTTVNINGGSIISNHVINKLNTGYESGGGIYVSDSSNLILDNETSVNNNTATYHGGGIYACRNANVSLKDCTVTRNVCDSVNSTISAHFYGGGFYFGTTNMNYQRISSSAGLEAGAKYIFVASTNSNPNSYVAMGHQNMHNRTPVGVTVSNNAVNLIPAASPSDMTSAYEFVLGGSTDEWTLFDPVNNGYLYASDTVGTTGPSMDVQAVLDDRGKWKDTWDVNGKVLFTSNTTTNYNPDYKRNKINLKADKSNFSCFATQQTTTTSLYKHVPSESNHGSITISDNAKVFGNFAGSNTDAPASNLYLAEVSNTGSNRSVININGFLRQNANIHISTPSPSAGDTIARGTTTPAYTITESDIKYLHYDDGNYGIKLDDNNQAILVPRKTLSFDMNGPEEPNPDDMNVSVGETVTLPVPSAMSYEVDGVKKVFVGWGESSDATTGRITYLITEEWTTKTLYAIWKSFTTDSPYVYLDGEHNITADNVGSISNPVNTLAAAATIMYNYIHDAGGMNNGKTGKIIVINNPCRIQKNNRLFDFELYWMKEQVVVTRYMGDVEGYPDAYRGDMFLIEDYAHININNIVIDGGYTGTEETKAHGSIVSLSGVSSKLTIGTGVILRNNYNEYCQSLSDISGLGGAIHAYSSDTIVMEEGSSIESCFAKSGGGIYAYNATIKMDGGNIGGSLTQGNGATDYGSAIAAFAASNIELSSGLISHNYDLGNRLDGTVYIEDNGYCKLLKNTNNHDLYVTISNNKAKYGGGISARNTTLDILNGLIDFNTATTNGGGVYVQYATNGTFEGGYISNNTASYGGGVYICSGGKFTAENGEGNSNGSFGQIIQNKANYFGGGVYIEPSIDNAAKGYLYIGGSTIIMTNTKDNIANNVYLPLAEIGNSAMVFISHLKGYIGVTTEEIPQPAPNEKNVLTGVSHELNIKLDETDAGNIYSDNTKYNSYLDTSTGEIFLRTTSSNHGNLPYVFLDGVNGNDDYTGTEPCTYTDEETNVNAVNGEGDTIGPVKTFDKAKSLMQETDAVLYIVDTVNVHTTGQTWSFNNKINASIKRYPGVSIENVTQTAAVFNGPLANVYNDGYLIMNGIVVDGDTIATTTSPLINVGDRGVVTIFDGSILQNNYNINNGGAINIAAGGTVNMYSGCYIRNNSAANGGGIFMENTNGTKTSRLIIGENVEISNNTANGTSPANGFGGGIYCGHGNIDLYGGVINNNTAMANGGGIYVLAKETIGETTYHHGTLHVAVNPIISDNTPGNVYLANDSNPENAVFIFHDEQLIKPADIGINLKDLPNNENPTILVAQSTDYNDSIIPANEAALYHSDQMNYYTELEDDGKVYIKAKEYWKDHVRVKPIEGWTEETKTIDISSLDPNPYAPTQRLIYNIIHISTPEAFAWLISVINGENGQTPYNFNPIRTEEGGVVTMTYNWIYLDNDIDISAYLWTPLGTEDHPFNGFFYGKGNTITGCSVFETDMDYVGLFGYAPNIIISNLGIVDASINGDSCVGGLVGYINAEWSDDWNSGGFQHFGRIINCHSSGKISGNNCVGGLIGRTNTIVANCYSIPKLTATGVNKGSVIGYYESNGHTAVANDLRYCYGSSSLNVVGNIPNANLPNIRTLQEETNVLSTTIEIDPIYDTLNTKMTFINLTDALNGYVSYESNSPLYSNDIYSKMYKWKNIGSDVYPVHADEYSYWIDAVKSVTDAGIGYVEVKEGSTLKEVHIKSAEGLAWLISVVNGINGATPNSMTGVYVYLDDNIDMSGQEFTPIGNEEHPFNGIFAADGYKIDGIYMCDYNGKSGYDGWYDPSGTKSIGFFGHIGPDALIRNLYLGENCYITSRSQYLGGIVGYNQGGMYKGGLYNCCYQGTIGGDKIVGGIAGINYGGKIHNCFAKTTLDMVPISENNYFGGVVGINDTVCYGNSVAYRGEIVNSYVYLKTVIFNDYCGLIVGKNFGKVDYVYMKQSGGITNTGDRYVSNETAAGATFGVYSTFSGTNSLSQTIDIANPTQYMLTALNEFVNEEQIGVYSTWDITSGINEGYPYFKYDEPFANVLPDSKWNEIIDDDYVLVNKLEFAGGDGSKNNPYIIDNEERLVLLSGLVNAEIKHYGNSEYSGTESEPNPYINARNDFYDKYYKITKDLDMSAYRWNRIGKSVVSPNIGTLVNHTELENFEDNTINPFFTKIDSIYPQPFNNGNDSTGNPNSYPFIDSISDPNNGGAGGSQGYLYRNNTKQKDAYSPCYEFTIPSDAQNISVSFDVIKKGSYGRFRCYVQKKVDVNWEERYTIVSEVNGTTVNPWIAINSYIGTINTSWTTVKVEDYINSHENCEPFEAGHTYRIHWMIGVNGAIVKFDNLKVMYDTETAENLYFSGQIDGNNHIVEGIYINETDNNHGLVGCLKKEEGQSFTPTIKNLGVSSSFIKNIQGNSFIGGVVGYNEGGLIYNCHNEGYIYGKENIGGIVGYNTYGGRVYNCYNNGSISGTINVGGITGYNWRNSVVANSYNRGSINASDSLGGGILGNNNGILLNVYSAAMVTGNYIGGVLGRNDNDTITNAEECYWDSDNTNGVGIGSINKNGLRFHGSSSSWIFRDTPTAELTGIGRSSSAKDLVIALNTQVEYSNIDNYTNYHIWKSDANVNDGYPVFSDAYNFSGNVLWYADYPGNTDYTLNTISDLKGLAGLNNHYNGETPYCYYDDDGVIRGYGATNTHESYNVVACTDFAGKNINLAENVVFNDGRFLEDGTYIAGPTQNATPAEWESIGTATSPFKGSFNGNRKIVKGLYQNSIDTISGMFGVVNGMIKSLSIEGCYLETSGNNSYIGGIAGKLIRPSDASEDSDTIMMQNCYYAGYVINNGTGESYAGGLAGLLVNNAATDTAYILNSYNWANVTTSSTNTTAFAGGIVGKNEGEIENTYNSGTITSYINGTTNNAGAIAGKQTARGRIEKSYYLQMTNAQLTGAGSSGITIDTSAFSGSGENCILDVSPYNYSSLKATLNAWCGFQHQSFDNWVVIDKYPIMMSHNMFWPDMVTVKPEGFIVSGNTITISTKEGLAWLASVVNGYNSEIGSDLKGNTVIIANDLDMIDYQWVAIGSNDKPFKGTVLGNHFAITNLNKNSSRDLSDTIVGMFGYVVDSEIRGVVNNNSIYSFTDEKVIVGGIVAKADGASKIIGCRSSNMAYSNNKRSWLGGLAGWLKGTSEIISSSTMCQAAGYNLGGIVYRMDSGTKLINSYSKTISIDKNTTDDPTNFQGGLVGDNAGTIENCYYLRNRVQTNTSLTGSCKGFLVGRNTGNMKFCYTNNKNYDYPSFNTYGFTTGDGTMEECGYFFSIYDPVFSSLPINDSRRFNQIIYLQNVNNSNQVVDGDSPGTYVTSGTTTLREALNGWRLYPTSNTTDNNFEWIQVSNIFNTNFPLFRYSNYEALATKGEGQLMYYHKKFHDIVKRFNGEIDGGNIAIINNTNLIGYSISNNDNVNVYIKDGVSLIHDESSKITATVETFIDNSAAQSREYREPYGDWHLASMSVKNIPIGITHSSEESIPYGTEPNITGVSNDGIIPYKSSSELSKWDFYSYYEPEYHWINYKRNSASHWHFDEPHNNISYTNDMNMVAGKGYLLSFAEEQTLLPIGEVNNGNITINVTRGAPYCTGYNLIGNPYQSYLDFQRFASINSAILGDNLAYYIYDNDKPGWMTYLSGQTVSNLTASQYINMHQGFFIISKRDGTNTVSFTNEMRTEEKDSQTAFRNPIFSNLKPSYPIISVLMSDEDSLTENVIVELNRPDAGHGALRLSQVRDGMGTIYIPQDNKDYWVMFYDETNNIPLSFTAYEEGQFSLEVNTENATFSYLHLIDNITGDDVNLLETNKYVFKGSPSDYSYRFRLMFEYIGIEENDEVTTNDNFAYYNNGDLIVNGEGDLQIIDLQGRILLQKHVSGENKRVILPSLVEGVYILRLLSEDVKTQKILIH